MQSKVYTLNYKYNYTTSIIYIYLPTTPTYSYLLSSIGHQQISQEGPVVPGSRDLYGICLDYMNV